MENADRRGFGQFAETRLAFGQLMGTSNALGDVGAGSDRADECPFIVKLGLESDSYLKRPPVGGLCCHDVLLVACMTGFDGDLLLSEVKRCAV